MNRVATFLLVALLAVSAVFAAGNIEAANSASSSSGSGDSSLTEIRVMVYERGSDFPSGYSTADNRTTRWINEEMAKVGVKVTYVPIPRSSADNTINTMLAAGNAPDIVLTYDKARVATYGRQGGLVDLAPYVDRLDPEWLEKASVSALEQCQFDGHQYALPRMFEIYGRSHNTYIRKDIVEELGMEMPTTRDELIAFLYAVKENYPDIIPYGFSGKITDGKYTNFVLSYTSRADERANYIYEPTFTNILKEGGKEGLRQLNRFVLDGIIPKDFAIDTDESKFLQNLANGKVAFLMDGSAEDAYLPYSYDPDYQMWPVDTLPNADGDYIFPSAQPVSNYVYVPKTAEKKIDAVMKYLAFLSNRDNAVDLEYCLLGVGSELNEEGVPVKKSSAELKQMGFAQNTGDLDLLKRTLFFGEKNFIDNKVAAASYVPREFFEAEYEIRYNPEHYYDAKTIGSALASDQYSPLLQSLIVQLVFKCMTAPEGQFDAVYEAEYKNLMDNHLGQLLQERADYYDKYVAK